MKKILLAAVLAIGSAAGVADASLLNGVFSIDIYNFNAAGIAANADATALNVTANAGNFVKTITYTGNLNFFTPPGTDIDTFLTSGGGSYTPTSPSDLSTITLSSGVGSTPPQAQFQITTLLDIITINPLSTAVTGTIEHDDGISLFDFNNTLVTPASAADPTVPVDTTFALPAGHFRLIYSAANGNPEVLNVDVTPVPLPAAVWLFGSALVGVGVVGRRNKKA